MIDKLITDQSPEFADILLCTRPNKNENIILHWVRTEFNLPPSIVEKCENHFLRVWEGAYIYTAVRDGSILLANGDSYSVHWQSTPEVVYSAKKVACSFREYNGKKYVVIKVWKGEQE